MAMTLVSPYDAIAPGFDRHRAMPDGVAEAIRSAILASIEVPRPPRLLDLGAGTGRVGWPFVEAGDDYVGVDLSYGMLRAFRQRVGRTNGTAQRLVRSDGELLPFRDATFDAVMLIQVFSGARGWRRLLDEAGRVARPAGALVIGRTVAPADGIDALMRQHLAALLAEMGAPSYQTSPHDDVQRELETRAHGVASMVAAAWTAERTPRGFVDRHRTGARFATLPAPIQEEALRKVSAWAAATFGSLDAAAFERHVFELRVFKFREGVDR
jgi:ubiquinone/menaquinone biosynthesis C-methylase UbiE